MYKPLPSELIIKDFLKEIKKEQAELNESTKESFRQRDERILLSNKEKKSII